MFLLIRVCDKLVLINATLSGLEHTWGYTNVQKNCFSTLSKDHFGSKGKLGLFHLQIFGKFNLMFLIYHTHIMEYYLFIRQENKLYKILV